MRFAFAGLAAPEGKEVFVHSILELEQPDFELREGIV